MAKLKVATKSVGKNQKRDAKGKIVKVDMQKSRTAKAAAKKKKRVLTAEHKMRIGKGVRKAYKTGKTNPKGPNKGRAALRPGRKPKVAAAPAAKKPGRKPKAAAAAPAAPAKKRGRPSNAAKAAAAAAAAPAKKRGRPSNAAKAAAAAAAAPAKKRGRPPKAAAAPAKAAKATKAAKGGKKTRKL